MLKLEDRNVTLRKTLVVVGSLFLCTGCAGLLAEQCFEKLLTNLVGASTPAAAIVLSVYFLGLTLGALLYGKYRDIRWKPLRVYAFLEGGIGAWALLLVLTHQLMVLLFAPLLGLGVNNFWVLQSLRFFVACVWILPPTMLMGATFPAIVDFLERSRIPRPRQAMSRFYSLNLAGAIMGALLGPYWSLPSWGLHGTLIFTAVVDITVAVEVYVLAKRMKQRYRIQMVQVPEIRIQRKAFIEHKVLLTIAFLSGFLFFGLEVLWTHLIGAVLGNSVYAFAAMLALVLIGLGIGGFLSVILFKENRPISPLFTSMMLLGASGALVWQYTIWPQIPYQFILWGGGLTEFWEGELLRWLQAGRLLLPVAVILGMVYPSLFRLRVFPIHNRAQVAALISGTNSIGCILGALLCGFGLIPWLGSERTLLLFGILGAISGLLLSLVYSQGLPRIFIATAFVLLLSGWAMTNDWNRLSLTSGGHVYFREGHVNRFSTLAYFHEDTLGGITTVIYNPPLPMQGSGTVPPSKATRILLTNGKFQADDGPERNAQTGFALVPVLHAHERRDALVIGLGSGHTAETVKSMGFGQVDIAEIAPGIVDAARKHFASINGGLLDRRDIRLFLEDGRNYLLLHRKKYDLITMEISSIWFSGSTSLYSREFYGLCKSHLHPGGIMQQWIQIHHIGIDELGSVIATIRQVFPYVSFWVIGGQGILVGSEGPQKIQAAAVETYFQRNLWRDPDEPAIRRRFIGILASRLLAPEDTDRMLSKLDFTINTDANRFLEYATPRYNLSHQPHERINVNLLFQFATFPKHQPDPAWPEILADPARRATPSTK